MQIVIDIDENVFTRLFDNGTEDYEIVNDDLFAIAKSIRKGTPLPKGHGSLIETNTIQSMARKKAEDCFPEGRYDYGYRKALFDFAKDIDEAPVIIKADNTESEDKEK